MRRRILYTLGLTLFFGTLIGVPLAYKYFTIPPTCNDGIVNQGETAPDRGGPCPLVDVRRLSPSSVLWARAFRMRLPVSDAAHPGGTYTAIAYVQNPNDDAGVAKARYIFRLYDEQNILVAEREGKTFIMPGGITPIIEANIDTGNRIATHTLFQFTDRLTWERFDDVSHNISVTNRTVRDVATTPRIEAEALNTSVTTKTDLQFAAAVFDTAGNAFAASATQLDRLEAGARAPIVFTWPSSFAVQIGRVDIIPLLPPKPAWRAK